MKSIGNSFLASIKRFNFKLVLTLCACIILFLSVFLVLWDLGFEIPVSIAYGVITLITAAWYIFANRGMVGKLPKEEELPPTWDKNERQAFLEDLRARRKKTKRAMLILIPMIIVFAYKILDLYLFPDFSLTAFISLLFSK